MGKAVLVVIGGSGTSELFSDLKQDKISTPYGECTFYWTNVAGKEVAFISRHGLKHSLPPHKVNYRANVFAAKEIGNGYVLATNAVGSMNKKFRPGDFVLVDQVVDFTKSRPLTFYEGGEKVVHTDVTFPFSNKLSSIIKKASRNAKVKIHFGGTYVCTEGPRFETAAEIKMFKKLGFDLVGMTLVPEVFLARELNLEYSSVCIVTNWAAGIAKKVSSEEVIEVMKKTEEKLRRVVEETVKLI